MQRAAAASGMVSLAPCHLAIHREVGLWLGLRAVLVFDCPGPEQPRLTTPPPCDACAEKPCLPLLKRATGGGNGPPRSIRRRWEPWLAMRDVCPVGREHRYGERQIRYHYAVDRVALGKAVLEKG